MVQPYAFAGAKFYIGTTVAAADESDYAADTYVQVQGAQTYADLGDSMQDIPSATMDSDRTVHLRGTRDGGVGQYDFERDDADAGQIAMLAAYNAAGQLNYNFKIEWNNKRTTGGTNGATFFSGQVSGASIPAASSPNAIVVRRFMISRNTALVELPPT